MLLCGIRTKFLCNLAPKRAFRYALEGAAGDDFLLSLNVLYAIQIYPICQSHWYVCMDKTRFNVDAFHRSYKNDTIEGQAEFL